MSSLRETLSDDVFNQPVRARFEVFLDEHRRALHDCLIGLTEEQATSALGLDDLLHGNRRGPLPLRWVYPHMLRELAQHCGYADILREQLTAAPDPA